MSDESKRDEYPRVWRTQDVLSAMYRATGRTYDGETDRLILSLGPDDEPEDGGMEPMTVSRAYAERLHRSLEAALYPWGEPGDVPTEIGEWEMQTRDGLDDEYGWGPSEPLRVRVWGQTDTGERQLEALGIGFIWTPARLRSFRGSDSVRFRRRPTPEAPE